VKSILVAIPYTDDRLFDETITCALALDVPSGARVDYLFQRGNGDDLDLPDRRERIVRKRNQAREAVLSSGYNYLCFIDSDVVFHPDTLARLYDTMIAYDPAVVYGLYVVRKPPHWWCCSIDMEQRDGQAYHYVLSNDPNAARAMWDEPALHVTGIGFGMTLINTDIFREGVSFRFVSESNQYEDYWFGYDIKQLRYVQMMNLTARLGHIMTDCKHVVWPNNGETLYMVHPLQ
jgi:glycosyltransferase involved in cell wall biosynthesis